MANDLTNHRLHLVYLNWIYNKVLGLIIVLLRCFFKAFSDTLYTVVQNVRKADQQRSRNILKLHLVNQLSQVNSSRIFSWRNLYISLVIYTEIRITPASDIIQLFRIFNFPFSHIYKTLLKIK